MTPAVPKAGAPLAPRSKPHDQRQVLVVGDWVGHIPGLVIGSADFH